MKRAALLVALAVILGSAVGWLSASAIPPSAARASHAPVLRDGRAMAAAALERFVALDLGQPPEEILPPAPPPPDVAVLFRRDLTAIERTLAGPVAWVIDLDTFSGRRALKPGDVYRDRWRVSSVSEQAVELRRGRERRRVSSFDPFPEPELEAEPEPSSGND